MGKPSALSENFLRIVYNIAHNLSSIPNKAALIFITAQHPPAQAG